MGLTPLSAKRSAAVAASCGPVPSAETPDPAATVHLVVERIATM
jgi:hypothetical protein